MLEHIRSFFETRIAPVEGHARDEHALHLAAAMLLLEVSRADFSVRDSELDQIGQALSQTFGLSAGERDELVRLAREESDQVLSIHPFVQLVNREFDAAEKARLIEDLWRVAYVDGRLDKYEEYHIRKIADLLYVPHSEFIRTKHRAIDASGAPDPGER